MSDSLQPPGLQPTRLLCPWGFSLQEYWNGLPCSPPGDFPNPGTEPRSPALQVDSLLSHQEIQFYIYIYIFMCVCVSSRSLLQGIFPTQKSNPGLPHWRQILYQLNHQGSPRITEWVAYPLSSRSSQPRNPTGLSRVVRRSFTN